jgi:rubredoxin
MILYVILCFWVIDSFGFNFGEVLMAVYRCRVCGYIFDEEKEGKSIRDIDYCPRCKQPDDRFELVEDTDTEKRSDGQ